MKRNLSRSFHLDVLPNRDETENRRKRFVILSICLIENFEYRFYCREITLSGGQRQRISLARAIYSGRGPSSYLTIHCLPLMHMLVIIFFKNVHRSKRNTFKIK